MNFRQHSKKLLKNSTVQTEFGRRARALGAEIEIKLSA